MVTLRIEDLEKIIDEKLKAVTTEIKSIKEDTKEIRIKVNQVYDAVTSDRRNVNSRF